METLKVVRLKSESKSFSWNDGLFAIQKQVGDIVHLWKIKDGVLDRCENGTPNITCTGINNKGIIPTDLFVYMKEDQKQQSPILTTITCRLCGEKGKVIQIEYGQKHCTNCGNCW